MGRSVGEIRKSHQRNRTEEIFRLVEKGKTFDEAKAIITRRQEVGTNSEAAFVDAMSGELGVGRVRMASERKDYVHGIDVIVETEPPLVERKWEVQVKSNDRDVQAYLAGFRSGYGVETKEQVKRAMAQNGKMVIDAGKFRNDPKKNEGSIRSQFKDWIRLSD